MEIPHGVRAIDIMAQLKPDIDKVEGLKLIEDIEIADTAILRCSPECECFLKACRRIAGRSSLRQRVGCCSDGSKAAGLPVPDRIISGDQVKRGKPDPEPYRRGAELLGVQPQDCLVVEDAPSGVRAGVAAGCRVLGVLGTHKAEELREAGASWIVSSLDRRSGRRRATDESRSSIENDLAARDCAASRRSDPMKILFGVDADRVVRTLG